MHSPPQCYTAAAVLYTGWKVGPNRIRILDLRKIDSLRRSSKLD